MTPAFLYRHFDADGRLLYVGISLSAVSRLSAHSRAGWAQDIRRVEVEHYPTRGLASDAEVAAIRSENPVYNKQHTAHYNHAPGNSTQTVSELFDTLGRKRIREEAGHGFQVMTRAIKENTMPAHWHFGIRKICDDEGVQCPDHLFRSERRPAAKIAESAA